MGPHLYNYVRTTLRGNKATNRLALSGNVDTHSPTQQPGIPRIYIYSYYTAESRKPLASGLYHYIIIHITNSPERITVVITRLASFDYGCLISDHFSLKQQPFRNGCQSKFFCKEQHTKSCNHLRPKYISVANPRIKLRQTCCQIGRLECKNTLKRLYFR